MPPEGGQGAEGVEPPGDPCHGVEVGVTQVTEDLEQHLWGQAGQGQRHCELVSVHPLD